MKFIRSNKPSSLSDEELITEFRLTGNKKSIANLFERYAHLVFGVCMKYLKDQDAAQDAAMEIFEKLFSDLQKHEVKYFKSWLYMVTKNHCLMQLRQEQSLRKKRIDFHKDESQLVEIHDEWHLEKIAAEIHLENLSAAIQKLNAEQKTCIELFYLREKSYQEIAEQTGFSLMSVKSFIQNGKRNLKIFLLTLNEQRID